MDSAERIVSKLLRKSASFQTHELAEALGVTRQMAHRILRRMVTAGLLRREGAGRAARYVRAPAAHQEFVFSVPGLQEDVVWQEVRKGATAWQGLPDPAERMLHYAVTELVNNVIDHSSAATLRLSVSAALTPLSFDVVDDGVGIFAHLQRRLNLPDELAALQELSKGKTTTQPERHSGEGIFFVSKLADYFEIDSGGIVWKVDNVRADSSVGSAPVRQGTCVRFEVARDKSVRLSDVFDAYTTDFEFTKTRIRVQLFTYGTRFISRSEARRLLVGLEKFREIVLDFKDVTDVGQGFADEVFRVWGRAHPAVKLVAENMAPPVAFMVERARHAP